MPRFAIRDGSGRIREAQCVESQKLAQISFKVARERAIESVLPGSRKNATSVNDDVVPLSIRRQRRGWRMARVMECRGGGALPLWPMASSRQRSSCPPNSKWTRVH